VRTQAEKVTEQVPEQGKQGSGHVSSQGHAGPNILMRETVQSRRRVGQRTYNSLDKTRRETAKQGGRGKGEAKNHDRAGHGNKEEQRGIVDPGRGDNGDRGRVRYPSDSRRHDKTRNMGGLVIMATVTMAVGGGSVILPTVGVTTIKNVGRFVIPATITRKVGGGSVTPATVCVTRVKTKVEGLVILTTVTMDIGEGSGIPVTIGVTITKKPEESSDQVHSDKGDRGRVSDPRHGWRHENRKGGRGRVCDPFHDRRHEEKKHVGGSVIFATVTRAIGGGSVILPAVGVMIKQETREK
jgi:hypothetical protein